MKLHAATLAFVALTTSAFGAAPPLRYEATILTYACLTANNAHRCAVLPDKITETIELLPDESVNHWSKWVKAKNFANNFDFSFNVRLKRNADGKSYTFSSFFLNLWAGAFDLGQAKLKLDSIEEAPKEWMIGSSEVTVGEGQSYSARLILKKLP